MQKEIKIKTNKKQEIIDITDKIKEAILNEAGEGLCFISTAHTTAGILINEISDSALSSDIINKLNQLIEDSGNYRHDIHDNNASAHIKTSIVGNSKLVPLHKGKLVLGAWQRIGLAESDGPRERKVLIKIIEG